MTSIDLSVACSWIRLQLGYQFIFHGSMGERSFAGSIYSKVRPRKRLSRSRLGSNFDDTFHSRFFCAWTMAALKGGPFGEVDALEQTFQER